MDYVIYKYNIDSMSVIISLPTGFEILKVDIQGDQPVLWALVNPDPDCKKEMVSIKLFFTGISMSDHPGKYISTFTKDGLVFHAFKS